MVKFESGNTSANVPPIVEISATVQGTYTFTNCGFIYGSTTDKTGNSQASGIYNNAFSSVNRIVTLYCSFFLFGTTSASNFAIQDEAFGSPSQAIKLHYMNNASLGNTHHIRGTNNATKFALQTLA
jgi:hypothetical protein